MSYKIGNPYYTRVCFLCVKELRANDLKVTSHGNGSLVKFCSYSCCQQFANEYAKRCESFFAFEKNFYTALKQKDFSDFSTLMESLKNNGSSVWQTTMCKFAYAEFVAMLYEDDRTHFPIHCVVPVMITLAKSMNVFRLFKFSDVVLSNLTAFRAESLQIEQSVVVSLADLKIKNCAYKDALDLANVAHVGRANALLYLRNSSVKLRALCGLKQFGKARVVFNVLVALLFPAKFDQTSEFVYTVITTIIELIEVAVVLDMLWENVNTIICMAQTLIPTVGMDQMFGYDLTVSLDRNICIAYMAYKSGDIHSAVSTYRSHVFSQEKLLHNAVRAELSFIIAKYMQYIGDPNAAILNYEVADSLFSEQFIGGCAYNVEIAVCLEQCRNKIKK